MSEPAALIATAEAAVPPGGEAEWFAGAGGARLRAALFTPIGRARGSVIVSGGRTETIEKYYEVIGELLERGFVVLAHDWRGQGFSARELPDRLKGHARGYKAYLDDFQALLRAFEGRLPKPWVALGHSMGGGLTLLALAHGERRFAGALLSAPMLGVRTGAVPQRTARLAARLQNLIGRAGRYVPGQPRDPLAQAFEGNVLTHDRARFERNCGLIAAEPQLALGAPTWGWLDFALRAAAYLANPDRLRGITVPVIILQAEDDRLVDNAAQDAAARHLPQGQVIRVPGAYHEILMETDLMRSFFLRMFDTLTGRVAPKPTATPQPADAARPAEAAAPAAAPPAPAAPAAAPLKAKAQPAARKAAAPKAAAPKTAEAPAAQKPAATKPAGAKPAARSAAKTPARTKAPAKPAAAGKKPAPKAAVAPAPKTAAKAAKPAVKASAAKAPAKAPTNAKASAKTTPVKTAPVKTASAKAAASKAHAPKTSAPKTSAPKPAAKKPAARKTPTAR